MTHTQYLATITSDTAGLLRRAGCQILSATAINGQSWLKVRLPIHISDDERRHLLAMAWKAPAAIEWRVQ